MCRIAGYWDFQYKGGYEMTDTVICMRDRLAHGGPDDAGHWIDPNRGLAFGHRRLSIIDLSSAGHQPMGFRKTVIVYNGEVYNYREVRAELEQGGYAFDSGSDTEVILKAYDRWGPDCVRRFRGMWAFAIWDGRTESLHLCRDRAGVKPLYWYFKDGLLIFASELKAFHEHPGFTKSLDRRSAQLYFQYGYVPAPRAIFEHVRKIRPGHWLTVDRNGAVRESEYWNIKDSYIRGFSAGRSRWRGMTEREIENDLEERLFEAFKLRLVSDVPVGVFLSSGIDSSAVAALLQARSGQRLKTFTIGFYGKKEYDEAPWARKIAEHLGTEHVEHYFEPKEAAEILEKIPSLYDEPFGDSSALPTYLVSSVARRHVKVALSADGGDELFQGYGFYRRAFPTWTHPAMRWISGARWKRKMLEAWDRRFQAKRVTAFYPSRLRRGVSLLRDVDFREGWDLPTALMYLDFVGYLPDDILVKVDRATMGVALEGREPFLDHRLVEHVAEMPVEYKYRDRVPKYLLRKILYRYVPESLLRRSKHGFSVPLDDPEYRGKLEAMFDHHLSERRLRRTDMIDTRLVRRLLGRWKAGKIRHDKLWYTLCFQIWAETYL
jgi:asparagine synthase (glutamine-hydrolysing)